MKRRGREGGGQCKTKIKNLTGKYRKVKNGNRKSGNRLDSSFVYFVEMDAVRGTRAASSFAHVNKIQIRSGLNTNRI